jgi:hypothetical protein
VLKAVLVRVGGSPNKARGEVISVMEKLNHLFPETPICDFNLELVVGSNTSLYFKY